MTTNGYLRAEDCRLVDLVQLLEEGASEDLSAYPHADRLEQGVLVYEARTVRAVVEADGRRALQAEIAHALSGGPGIVVFTGAFGDDVLDPVTDAFERILATEKAAGGGGGDHFAAPGTNDRAWNALEKLALADPESFVDYYANDVLALASVSWLGPGYQLTSQLNVVNPGGQPQTVHRDYHLGFQSPTVSQQFPAHVHALSPALTLQGAVAHCDMPVETGPTLYLPHSQKYSHGYLAYWLQEFQEYFVAHHVQLPLDKGDAVFFNPALLHAAGANRTTDVRRMANLLQVSSAFGRAMEVVDRRRLVQTVYPVLLAGKDGRLSGEQVAAVVAATAEGYAFPTNLDHDPPLDGMSPLTQADLVHAALRESASPAALHARLEDHAARRRSR